MTGALTVPGVVNTGDYFLRNLANRHIRFEYLKNDGTWATDGYIYKDGVDAPNRRPGVRINCATPDKNTGNTSSSGDWVFGEDGTLTCPGAINGHWSGAGSYASQNDSGSLAPYFQLINDTASSKYYPILKQRYTQGGGTWTLGTIINAGNFQVFYVSKSDTAGKSFTFDKSGQFIPSSYANFDARYLTKSENLPVGIPLPWPTATPPSGWLICNGAAFNKTTYPALGAAYPSGNLPDLRGQFIRGLDNGRGVDPGRGILSTQAGQSPYSSVGSTYGNQTWNNRATVKTGYYMTTGTDNNGDYQIMAESQAQRETRPTNVAFNYIVRAA
ncbi:TPA: tail fiber protein [Enterobacter cloacae subsp. dissolvens]|nr:tail fiber protein [Enterobacter cloacae subsp. dissolvens]